MDNTEEKIEMIKRLEESQRKIDSLAMENKMLKMSLSESDRLHKSVVEHSLDGTIILDKELSVVYANDEIFRITGYQLDELYDNDFSGVIHPDHLDKVKNALFNFFSNPVNDYRFEFDILKKSKDRRNVYVSCSVVDDFQGSPAIIIQMLDTTDIKEAERRMREINKELEQRVTERTKQLEEAMNELKVEIAVRKKAEIELKEAKEEVQNALDKEKELNQLKTRFISMISHEYRTPLTVILTSSYLIEQFYEGSNQEQFNKFLNKIRGSVESMTQLLEDVLKIGKADSGKLDLQPEKVNLLSLFSDIIEEIRVVDKEKHEFDFNYTLSNSDILSDEKNLRHIFQNLLSNAAKYSPEADKVKITLTEKDDHHIIQIIDYGIGIPEEDQEHLFQSFHRAGNVGAISGTGLGLAIVKRCSEALGGNIRVDSEIGKGTTFTVKVLKDISNNGTLSTN